MMGCLINLIRREKERVKGKIGGKGLRNFR